MVRSPIPLAYREVLVTALFAVNSYSYDRVHALLPRFRAAHLLDPEHVTSLDIGPLTVAIYEAGYDRGLLTSRFAERLAGLMAALHKGDLDVTVRSVMSRAAGGPTHGAPMLS